MITLLLDPEHTGGALTSNRTLLKDGNTGAPPHRHTRSGELFFIISGELEMLVGDELHTLRPGDTQFVLHAPCTLLPRHLGMTPTSWS